MAMPDYDTAIFLFSFELVLSLSIALAVSSLWNTSSHLESFDGPFIAKHTRFWQLVINYQGRASKVQQKLHKQYGAAVRMGPNHISLDEPSLVKTIYSTSGNYIKSPLYSAANSRNANGEEIEIIFSTRNEATSTAMKRPIGKYYNHSHALRLEPVLDSCIQMFLRRLEEEFCGKGDGSKICDMDKWLYYIGWDAMHMMNFSSPMGFLEKGGDVDNSMKDMALASDCFSWCGQVLEIDRFLKYIGKPIFVGTAVSSLKQIALRRAKGKSPRSTSDFLEFFTELQRADPKSITDDTILNWTVNNMGASVNSVTAVVEAIVYYVLKNPMIYARMRRELEPLVGKAPVAWKDAQQLPYLDAIVQEAIRFHPPGGFTLERVVPQEGLILPDGRFLPGGTIVGMNAWVVNRNKTAFGFDAGIFNPERWLKGETEDDDTFEARLSRMRNANLSWGGGKRMCLGKQIGLMEVFKIAASLFVTFDMQLVEPEEDWEITDTLFVRVSGIEVYMKKRMAV